MKRSFPSCISISLISVGLAGLILGSLVYLTDRPPNQTYFIHRMLSTSLYRLFPKIFSIYGNFLPSFLHVFSFILITAGMLPRGDKYYLAISSAWISIGSLLELGQNFKQFTPKMVPNWFAELPFLENAKNYFLLGTFDIRDLAASALGGITAYLILIISDRRSA